jgi:hypothetical protein
MSHAHPMHEFAGRPSSVDRAVVSRLADRLAGIERRIHETKGALEILEGERASLRRELQLRRGEVP